MKPKQRLKRFLWVLVLLSLVSLPLYSEGSYTITEEQLNQLKEFQMEFELLQKEYLKLQDDYQKQTEDLKTQTEDLQNSLKTLKAQELKTNLIIGGVSVTVGFAIGGLIFYVLNK